MSSSTIQNDLEIFYNDILNKIYRDLFNGEKILIIKSNNKLKEENCDPLINFKKYIYHIENVNCFKNDINLSLIEKKHEDIVINENRKALIINKEIDVKTNKVLKIYNAFLQRDNEGESLIDLYNYTKQSLNGKNYKYKYYLYFVSIKDFINTNKNYIDRALTDEITEMVIKKFVKYKKFASNHLFSIIKENVELNDINTVLIKLKGLLNNSFALSPPIFINKYTDDFIQENLDIDSLTEEEVNELAKIVNKKYNNKNYIEEISFLWYKPSSWINYFLENKKSKIRKTDEIKGQQEIFHEYKENIDNLRLFKNSFNFLNLVIKKEYLNKISRYLLKEDELWTYLKTLEKSMDIYKEYKVVEESIRDLNVITLELLENCYRKFKSYEEIVEALKFIPMFYKYQSISEYEDKNKVILREYHKINELLDELWKIMKYQKEIIFSGDKLFFYKYQVFTISENYSNNFISEYGKYFSSIYNENNIICSREKIMNSPIYNTEKNYPFRTEIIKLILSLGYRVIKNYKLDNQFIDLVIVNQQNDKNIVVLYLDHMENFNIVNINYLLWMKKNDINLIVLWSKDWWEDRNNEVTKLKHLLSKYFQ